jgi:hypothetical protein
LVEKPATPSAPHCLKVVIMFKKILIANRGDNGCQAVAAKPNCLARAAHAGDFNPMETSHV